MLNCSRPRSRSARVMGKGNRFEGTPFSFPVYSSSSRCRCPRATVPGTTGRSERPSPKKLVGSSDTYFGWTCMSRRQPARTPANSTAAATARAIRPARRPKANLPSSGGPSSDINFEDSIGIQALQKRFRPCKIELLIARGDAQKKPVGPRLGELREIEHRKILRGQPVQRQHAKSCRQSRSQHRKFEGDRNPGRPAIVGAPADVPRQADHVRVVAHEKARQPAQNAADQDDQRQPGLLESDRLRKSFHGDRRICVDAPEARSVRFSRGFQHLFRRLKFGDQAVKLFSFHSLIRQALDLDSERAPGSSYEAVYSGPRAARNCAALLSIAPRGSSCR